MAKARALERRRRSIRSIRKITRTMELIARAKFKKAMDRAAAAGAYTRRITKLVSHLAQGGLEVSHRLLEPRPDIRLGTLLVLSANRGLCGGYNASVLRLAYARLESLRQEGVRRGWKSPGNGASAPSASAASGPMKTFTISTTARPSSKSTSWPSVTWTNTWPGASTSSTLLHPLRVGRRQQAVVETFAAGPAGRRRRTRTRPPGRRSTSFPSAESILGRDRAHELQDEVFKCFSTRRQRANCRMVAMKAATENAEAMIGSLSMAYNRARRARSPAELLEVMAARSPQSIDHAQTPATASRGAMEEKRKTLMATSTQHNIGRISQIIGSNFDVAFPEAHLPAIYNAVKVTARKGTFRSI